MAPHSEGVRSYTLRAASHDGKKASTIRKKGAERRQTWGVYGRTPFELLDMAAKRRQKGGKQIPNGAKWRQARRVYGRTPSELHRLAAIMHQKGDSKAPNGVKWR